MPFVNRETAPLLEKAARGSPALVLTGPRRFGKTSHLRHTYANASYQPRGLGGDHVRLSSHADGCPTVMRIAFTRPHGPESLVPHAPIAARSGSIPSYGSAWMSWIVAPSLPP
jgi:hypothetical protein